MARDSKLQRKAEKWRLEVGRNLRDMLIPHTRFQRAIDRMERLFRTSGEWSDGRCLVIAGDSGTGKSRALRCLENAHPEIRETEGRTVPVLRYKLPSSPTVKSLASGLLEAIGDPIYYRGTENVMTARLKHYLRRAFTRLIAIDEFQHFVDGISFKVHRRVADWLKVLIDETRLSLVVSGLPYCTAVMEQNSQLARRCMAPIELRGFDWTAEDEREEFVEVLDAMQRHLAVDRSAALKMPDLSDTEMAFRLYCGTDGRVGNLIKLLKELVEQVYEEGKPSRGASLREFYMAYAVGDWHSPDSANPFRKYFVKEFKRRSGN